MSKTYKKTTPRLEAKIVKVSTNEVIFTCPTNSMDVHQYFRNDFIDQIMKQTFGAQTEKIGDVLVVIDQYYQYS